MVLSRLRPILSEMVGHTSLSGELLRLTGEVVIAEAAFREAVRHDLPPVEYEMAVDALSKAWRAFFDEEEAGGYLRINADLTAPDPLVLALRAMLAACRRVPAL